MDFKEYKNKIKCLNCNKILISKDVHDYVSCDCDNQAFTDGGDEYQRFGAKDINKIAIWKNGEFIIHPLPSK